jgi:hypothetical protein
MGHTASRPNPNVKLQVIGAGMSRTGTTSFGAALEYLLEGPVYHGGTQLLENEESHIKTWIDLLHHTPFKNASDRDFVLDRVGKLIRGYVACTDIPFLAFVEELMQLHPDAKVIVTVRDPDRWWKSMEPVVTNGNLTVLSWILTPVPVLRFFRQFHDAMDDGRFGEIFYRKGERKQPSRVTYDRNIEYLKKVVPPEKLFFYDVRDGWEPLCKILNKPVPVDRPFPKLNDADVMENFIKSQVRRGLMYWAGIGGVMVAAAAVSLKLMRLV